MPSENYAFGVAGVRLGSFLLATAVGLVATIVLAVWMTRQAKIRMKQQAEPA